MSMQTISFSAPAEKIAALDTAAATERRDRTSILNEAIDQYLAWQQRRDEMTRTALASVDNEQTVPHHQVEAWAQSLSSDNPLPLPKSAAAARDES